MLTEAATYDELYRNFRWDVPHALQHGGGVLRPICRRLGPSRAGLRSTRTARRPAPPSTRSPRPSRVACQRAEGRWRLRAATVSRCSCRNRWSCRSRIWRRSGRGMISIPLFALFGEDALRIPPVELASKGDHHRRRRLGEAHKDPRSAALPARYLHHERRCSRRRKNRSGRRSNSTGARILPSRLRRILTATEFS